MRREAGLRTCCQLSQKGPQHTQKVASCSHPLAVRRCNQRCALHNAVLAYNSVLHKSGSLGLQVDSSLQIALGIVCSHPQLSSLARIVKLSSTLEDPFGLQLRWWTLPAVQAWELDVSSFQNLIQIWRHTCVELLASCCKLHLLPVQQTPKNN